MEVQPVILEEEIWKVIPGYEGYYQVSSLGRVKSLGRIVSGRHGTHTVRERILCQGFDGRGYFNHKLTIGGKSHQYKTHQLVMMAFRGYTRKESKMVIHHINEDKKDNRLSNLMITDNRTNVSLSKRPKSKITGVHISPSGQITSSIQIGGKLTYLGSFSEYYEAEYAYNQAVASTKNNEPVVIKLRSSKIGYKGVRFNGKTYSAVIEVNHKNITIGRFLDVESAARAYDLRAVELRGTKAKTNFPIENYI